MFERIANSWALAKSSFGVLASNKRLVVFPILSGLAFLAVVASFVTPFALRPDWVRALQDNTAVAVAVGFAFYLVTYFVIIFFNAALVSCALVAFHGGEPTVGDGLRAAFARLPQIFMWAMVSATVGILLKGVENINEKAGAFISAILGTVWSVITYFVIPVLVVERTGPFAAIGRSTSILKKTWGEALIGGMGVGLIVFLISLPGILLLIGGVALATGGNSVALGIAVAGAGLVWLLIASAVGSALQGIFVSALYHYAEVHTAPAGFEEETMRRAFTPKAAA